MLLERTTNIELRIYRSQDKKPDDNKYICNEYNDDLLYIEIYSSRKTTARY